MVAYSFKSRFSPAIREGWKTQTVRAERARHARPGEMLQLFTGMRTAQCKKICEDVRCTEVMAIGIQFSAKGEIVGIVTDGVRVLDLDNFANLDGFFDVKEMAEFWRENHAGIGEGIAVLFRGVLIEWAAPRPEAAQ